MTLTAIVSLLSGVALTACSVVGIRSGTEEPPYTVVRQVAPDLELRRYGARLAAETVVAGEETEARSQGFRRLAGFIFGGNQGGVSIAMTAPVSTGPSEKIAMTAPVAQTRTPEGWRIRFFMPAKYTLATLPRPNDPRIEIVEVPAQSYAVYRYSGFITVASVAAAHDALRSKLQAAGLATSGEVLNWFYDPPWTLPPLRRNEAAIALTEP